MDLIDDKGRLFGVVNIIDALVVLLVVAVVVAGVALVRQAPSESEAPETSELTLQVKAQNIHPAIADSIQTGMTEEIDGQTTARIVEKQVEPTKVVAQTDEGELILREHPIDKTLQLTVTVQARLANDDRLFHDEPLRIGSTIRLDFGTTVVEGTITEIK